MKSNGFTLVELLGVIIILSLLIVLVFPKIVNSVKNSTKDTDDTIKKIVYTAAKLYVDDNMNNYPNVNGNVYCIAVKDLIAEKYLEKKLVLSDGYDISDVKTVEVKYEDGYSYELKDSNSCKTIVLDSEYTDGTGSKVELGDGLIPVLYDGSNWKVADKSKKWYDYKIQEWANAVILKSGVTKNIGDIVNVSSEVQGMFVWVPRYEYKIEGTYGKGGTSVTSPGEIEINFIDKNKATASAGYKIHPAFTFGTKKLNGIWMGKFETSGTASAPTVLPNVTILRSQSINSQFTTSQVFNTYLNNSQLDSHMSKNSEWGAAIYLSQSRYGKYGNIGYTGANKQVMVNNCSSYKTGIGADSQNAGSSSATCTTNTYETEKGQAASTTGNIYGIYDMSGGAREYVMGNYNRVTANSGVAFTSLDSKYYDLYDSLTISSACSGVCFGHALSETSGWYGDNAAALTSNYTWFSRGGYYNDATAAGVFYFRNNSGASSTEYSFRVVISEN